MTIIDHSRWDFENVQYGIEDVKLIATHFSTALECQNFKLDAAVYEFRELKRLVKARYRHFKHSSSLWRIVASKHSETFCNILQIMEIILCMEWASSTVERGFSTVNRLLTDTRLRLSKDRLNNLLMIRINVPILTSLDPDYETKLVNKAVDYYLSTKRYHNTTSAASTADTHDFHSMKSSVDLFLPIATRHLNPSQLLQDDSYLVISGDECNNDNDEADEADVDSDQSDGDESTNAEKNQEAGQPFIQSKADDVDMS